jgi:hypothetical protein
MCHECNDGLDWGREREEQFEKMTETSEEGQGSVPRLPSSVSSRWAALRILPIETLGLRIGNPTVWVR